MAGEYSDSDDEYYANDDYETDDPESMTENGEDSYCDDENYAHDDCEANDPESMTENGEVSDSEDKNDAHDDETNDPESNEKSERYSGEQHYAIGGYSGEHHDALGDCDTSYSKSTTQSGGDQVNVYQQTYRAKNEDKQSGSYERFTAKDKTVSGEPFVDRSGNRGHKDEHTTSATYKVGDKSGYSEYYLEERVKHVKL